MAGILCIQSQPVIGNKDLNIKIIEEFINENIKKELDLVVLPEFFSTGINHAIFLNEPEDTIGGSTIAKIQEIAMKYQTNIIAGTVIEKDRDKLYNTTFALNREGKILAKYRKIHLFNYMGGTEGERITAGDKLVICNFDFGKVGLGICYDIRYPLHYKKLVQQDAEIIVLPTAWVIPLEKFKKSLKIEQEMWLALNKVRAFDNLVYTVSCNQIGKINDRIAAIGSSVIVAPTGEIIAKADNKPCTLYAQLDLNVVKHWKSVYPISSID